MYVNIGLYIEGMCGTVQIVILPKSGYIKFEIETDDFISEAQPYVIMVVGLINKLICAIYQFKIIKSGAFIQSNDKMRFVIILYVRFIPGLMLNFYGLPKGIERKNQRQY